MSDEPVTHIIRPPLPWREHDTDRTVCGHPASQFAADRVVDLDAARAMIKRYGRQRAAILMCMTCAGRVGSWPRWEENPAGRLARELEGAGWHPSGPRHELIIRELRAIELLIGEHRDEFDAAVAQLADVTTMADLRQARAKRGAR